MLSFLSLSLGWPFYPVGQSGRYTANSREGRLGGVVALEQSRSWEQPVLDDINGQAVLLQRDDAEDWFGVIVAEYDERRLDDTV
jgi:hypothetical protein